MNRSDIFDAITAERFRQERLRELGRFRFTAASPGLVHAERLPMLVGELGEIATQVEQQPDSGLMPVTHAGTFNWHAAGAAFDPEAGTREGLRTELIQLAAIAVAWIEAIDSANDSTAHSVTNAPASRPAFQPTSSKTPPSGA